MKIVIILPTYNEVENIEQIIVTLQESSKKYSQHQTHLLVVDDNSPDKTGDKVKELQGKVR